MPHRRAGSRGGSASQFKYASYDDWHYPPVAVTGSPNPIGIGTIDAAGHIAIAKPSDLARHYQGAHE